MGFLKLLILFLILPAALSLTLTPGNNYLLPNSAKIIATTESFPNGSPVRFTLTMTIDNGIPGSGVWSTCSVTSSTGFSRSASNSSKCGANVPITCTYPANDYPSSYLTLQVTLPDTTSCEILGSTTAFFSIGSSSSRCSGDCAYGVLPGGFGCTSGVFVSFQGCSYSYNSQSFTCTVTASDGQLLSGALISL